MFILAAACYGSAVWGAFSFFRTADAGAVAGKRLISLLAGAATAACLTLILRASDINPLQAMAAACFYVFATSTFWWAYVSARSTHLDFLGSDRQPTELLRDGPYRYVRHPFYTSYMAGWLAALIAVPSLLTVLIFAVLTIIYVRAARREEACFAESPLATEYATYRRETGRFLPGILRYSRR